MHISFLSSYLCVPMETCAVLPCYYPCLPVRATQSISPLEPLLLSQHGHLRVSAGRSIFLEFCIRYSCEPNVNTPASVHAVVPVSCSFFFIVEHFGCMDATSWAYPVDICVCLIQAVKLTQKIGTRKVRLLPWPTRPYDSEVCGTIHRKNLEQ